MHDDWAIRGAPMMNGAPKAFRLGTRPRPGPADTIHECGLSKTRFSADELLQSASGRKRRY